MTGVICNRRIAARVKQKGYKMLVRPAMIYGKETVSLIKQQQPEVDVAELKMLEFHCQQQRQTTLLMCISDAQLRLSSTDKVWLPAEATGHPLSGRLVVQPPPATVWMILSPKLLPDALIGAWICVNVRKTAQKIRV